METALPVVEVFGPTIQGEGILIGTPTYFIRLGGCDFRCIWCDSMHSVDEKQWASAPRQSAKTILNRLRSLPQGPEWVTISGGNPAIHPDGLCRPLVDNLHMNKYKVAVETQGTIFNSWLNSCDLVTVSPKGPSAGNITEATALGAFVGQCDVFVVFKFVIGNDQDLGYADAVVGALHSESIRYPIYLQPVNPFYGDKHVDKHRLLDDLEWLVNMAHNYTHLKKAIVLPQLHVLIWGNDLGR